MFSEQKLKRLQYVLLGIFVVLVLGYWFGYRAFSQRAADLDQPLTAAWNKLAAQAKTSPAFRGLDSAAMLAGLRELEVESAALERAAARARARIQMPGEMTDQPFQLIEFDKSRFTLMSDLRQFAASNKVALEPAALAGYPDFSAGLANPSLLWTQLAIVHQAVMTAVAHGPKSIQAVTPFPRRSHDLEDRVFLEEFPVRIELLGSRDAALQFLRSIPLLSEEMKEAGGPEVPLQKQALFLDRFILKNVTNELNQVHLDVIVTGFLDRTDLQP